MIGRKLRGTRHAPGWQATCHCRTCRADRIVWRVIWIGLAIGIGYFVVQTIIGLLKPVTS